MLVATGCANPLIAYAASVPMRGASYLCVSNGHGTRLVGTFAQLCQQTTWSVERLSLTRDVYASSPFGARSKLLSAGSPCHARRSHWLAMRFGTSLSSVMAWRKLPVRVQN